VSNQCGTTTYTLDARGRQCNEYLYVPDAFTPNGDGVNDLFQAFTSYDVSAFALKIFDRWGEKVFESNNYNQGWDGRYRGTALPAGVYVYEVSVVSLIGNTASKKGSLTLIR
jgi:gliding motility-associated-like protein